MNVSLVPYAAGGLLNAPTPPKPHQCPHGCKRDRHPEPLTSQVADMYDHHRFRSDYNPTEDDSPIVCVGANYYGPNRPPPLITTTFSLNGYYPVGTFIDSGPTLTYQSVLQTTWDTLNKILMLPTWKMPEMSLDWTQWFTGALEPLEPCETPEGVTVTFGTDWRPWEHAQRSEVRSNIKLAEHIRTHANDVPIPASPGYDFSKYAEEETTPYWIGAIK